MTDLNRGMPFEKKIIYPFAEENYRTLQSIYNESTALCNKIDLLQLVSCDILKALSNIAIILERTIPKEPIRSDVMITNMIPLTVGRQGRKFYYILSSSTQTLTVGRGTSGGTISLNANAWQLISFADTTQLFASSSTPTDIFYICSDEVIP